MRKGITSLYEWCLQNGDRGQQLINEWTGINENNNVVDINNINRSYKPKVLWKCSRCGHTWSSRINNRVFNGTNCPNCWDNSKSIVQREAKTKQGINDLYTWCNKNEYGDIVLNEWTGISINNNTYDIHNIASGSHIEMQWKCNICGNIYSMQVIKRTRHNNGCPICGMERAKQNHELTMVVKGVNDLYTWCQNNIFGSILMKEYTGITDDNKYYNIDEIGYCSAKKLKWICSNKNCGKEYYAIVFNKTFHFSRCPYCSKKGTSYAEQFIFNCFKQIYKNVYNRYKIPKHFYENRGKQLELDILIDFDNNISINGKYFSRLAIEYSPLFWHQNRLEYSNLKRNICNKNGIKYIEIFSSNSHKIEYNSEFIIDDIENKTFNKKQEKLNKIVLYIANIIGCNITDSIINNSVHKSIIDNT